MERPKLGIHILLLAAGAWLLALYTNLMTVLIYAGALLLIEDNAWLKKQCLRVLAVILTFSILNTVVYLIPNIRDLVNSFAALFDEYYQWIAVDKAVHIINELLYWVKLAIYLLSALFALGGKTIKLPVIDPFLDRYAV